MSYRLNWEAPCFDEIDALLAAGMPRGTIRQAVQSIENKLRVEPESTGLELSEGLRRLDVPPFHVYFDIDAANQVVNIVLLRFEPER